MKNCIKILLVFSITTFCFAKLKTKGDQSSGCGLGNYVTERKSLLATSTRSTTQISSPFRAFALTSGTSGCERHLLVLKRDTIGPHFLKFNKNELKANAAQGNGEGINSVIALYNCNNFQYLKKTFLTLKQENWHKALLHCH